MIHDWENIPPALKRELVQVFAEQFARNIESSGIWGVFSIQNLYVPNGVGTNFDGLFLNMLPRPLQYHILHEVARRIQYPTASDTVDRLDDMELRLLKLSEQLEARTMQYIPHNEMNIEPVLTKEEQVKELGFLGGNLFEPFMDTPRKDKPDFLPEVLDVAKQFHPDTLDEVDELDISGRIFIAYQKKTGDTVPLTGIDSLILSVRCDYPDSDDSYIESKVLETMVKYHESRNPKEKVK